jgi:hypothetical protein
VVAITAVPRDLLRRYPGEFEIGVSTSHAELWLNNPLVKIMPELTGAEVIQNLQNDGWRIITMRNPRVNESNRLPQHYLSSWSDYLSRILGRPFEVTEFKGDIYMAENEVAEYPVKDPGGEEVKYWIMISGGKQDFTAHWPVHEWMQNVADRFQAEFGPKIRVVQIGAAGDFHKPIKGAIDLRGKTTLRSLIQLVHHCEGTVGPNTMLPHLAAAVPIKRPAFDLGLPAHPHQDKCHNLRQGQPLRPSVVIGGASMPATWSQYPGHTFIQNVGKLPCCAAGSCWRSRCQKIGDGHINDDQFLCAYPTLIGDVNYSRCMVMIKPETIFSAIMGYYEGGALEVPK